MGEERKGWLALPRWWERQKGGGKGRGIRFSNRKNTQASKELNSVKGIVKREEGKKLLRRAANLWTLFLLIAVVCS
mgnify:CR=1 FL=1